MATIENSLGSLAELFGTASPATLPIVKGAHKLILSIHPETVIVPRLGERSICYGVGPKKLSESYCYLIAYKNHVNLGFIHGSRLDSDDVLEGTGPLMRHLKISSVQELSSPKIKKLITAALRDRRAAQLK